MEDEMPIWRMRAHHEYFMLEITSKGIPLVNRRHENNSHDLLCLRLRASILNPAWFTTSLLSQTSYLEIKTGYC